MTIKAAICIIASHDMELDKTFTDVLISTHASAEKQFLLFLYGDYARKIMQNGSCLYVDICVCCIYDHRVIAARLPLSCVK
jgi:uracil DNA glycosylase